MIKIKSKILLYIGFLYISLPAMLFSLWWLKIYICVPIFFIIIYCLDGIFRRKVSDDREYYISKGSLILSLIYIFIICVLGGHGKLWTEHFADWPVRWAVFRDLVRFNWPCVFKDNSYSCYYFGYFLFPALVAKFLKYICVSNASFERMLAIVELIWSYISIYLIFLLIVDFMHKLIYKNDIDKVYGIKEILIILVGFTLFSGLDIIGYKTISDRSGLFMDNLDVWYRAFFPCTFSNLCDAFNQCIVFYIATLLVLLQDDMSFLIYIGGVSFISMIFPEVSLVVICIAILIKRIKHIKELVSISNAIGLIIGIIVLVFYMGQAGVQQSQSSGQMFRIEVTNIFHDIIFLFLEFYIYFILLYKRNHKDIIFITCGLTVSIFIFITYTAGDIEVPMRCSMAMVYYMLLMYIKEMLLYIKDKKTTFIRVCLILVFCIGLVTPYVCVYRTVVNTINSHGKVSIHDEQYSYATGYGSGVITQYVGYDYDNSLFHKTVGADVRISYNDDNK